jgi:lipoate-protein ligase A
MSELLLFVDPPAPGAENMRRDLELLELCARGGMAGAVRIYSFDPHCLSLGRLQPEADVDHEACARDRVDVVRRPSGGRAVLHAAEVTYAVACRASDPDLGGRVLESCARIHAAIALGLQGLGVTTLARAGSADQRGDARMLASRADCFAKPSAHELVDARGRKLVGSAQARRAGALLQHGSVLLEPHRAARYLRSSDRGSGSGCMRHLLGRPVSRSEVVDALVVGFKATLGKRLLTAVQATA